MRVMYRWMLIICSQQGSGAAAANNSKADLICLVRLPYTFSALVTVFKMMRCVSFRQS